MRSLDAADLPRCVHLRDTTRRYQGLTYNCTAAPPLHKPLSRPEALPPRPSASDKSGSSEAAARHAELEEFRLSLEAARDKEADERRRLKKSFVEAARDKQADKQETQEPLSIHRRQVCVKK